MKLAQFMTGENDALTGRMDGNIITEIKGSIFSAFSCTERKWDISDVKLLPPVNPPNVIAIGLNYHEHARESGKQVPDKPLIFLKATSSIIGPEDDIKLPPQASDSVDYEAELGIVMGKKAKDISPCEADDYILGYTCVNDVTARDCQENDGQWARAKSFDSFCPFGPFIETSADPESAAIKSYLNGKLKQNSEAEDMIFSYDEIISYCSRQMTLLPGTLITTGTPPGVGKGQKPPRYLRHGDEIEITIKGIGTLSNQVVKDISSSS